MGDIHFIGGIHGVGKGTICTKVCEQNNLLHITASELIKWNEISATDNKKVKDIEDTQDRLLRGLDNIIEADKSYLLDGHFCLFNAHGEVERVPLETFVKIAPKVIIVVIDKVKLIKQRLEKRDDKTYNYDVLENMQNIEKEYATEIASYLNVPLVKVKDGNIQPLIDVLK